MSDFFNKSDPFKSEKEFKTYTVYVKYKNGKVIAKKNITNVYPYMAKVRTQLDVVTCWYEN